jgi:hypothetical protein
VTLESNARVHGTQFRRIILEYVCNGKKHHAVVVQGEPECTVPRYSSSPRVLGAREEKDSVVI